MILRPSKHSSPDQTVINAALLLLQQLQAQRLVAYEDLRAHLKENVVGGDALLLPSISLLYLLGLVLYRPKADAFEYTVLS